MRDEQSGTASNLIRRHPVARGARSGGARTLFALVLMALATAASAAPIYKCVDAHARITFRDTPCASQALQTRLDVAGQPLIDPGAPRQATAPDTSRHRAHRRAHHASTAARKPRPPTSWECRAADGEVFYRHTRCPGSVPGDGVVRWQDGGGSPSGKRSRHRRNAWSRVPVHGVKIPRVEACRRIHSAGAAVRDGHLRDADVSTYDHLMGRDPCDDD